MRTRILTAALATLASLTACTTPPIQSEIPARVDLTPYQVAEDKAFPAEDVLWGGMVVDVRNSADFSEMEVLAYPLDRSQRPRLQAPTQGRFIARMPGYVERYDYPQGRFVTLRGKVVARREGMIDERLYVYPIVEAGQVHLWPLGFQDAGPHFSIGVGVGVYDWD